MEALNDANSRLEKYMTLKSDLEAKDKTIATLRSDLKAAQQSQTVR